MSGCDLKQSCRFRRTLLMLGLLSVAALAVYGSGIGRPAAQAKPVASLQVHHSHGSTSPAQPVSSQDAVGARGVPHTVHKPLLTDPNSAKTEPELVAAATPSLVAKEIEASSAGGRSLADETSRELMRKNIMLLQQGYDAFRDVPHYSATFERQERIEGDLHEPEKIDLKIRHEPFSVYMHWHSSDPGRELLYVDGEHDGKMMVRLGGLKGRFIPPISLDPEGSDARSRSRYPVTHAGILAISKILLRDRRQDLKNNVAFKCDFEENQICNDRNCYYFCIAFTNPSESEVYRKSIQFIDRELLIPICIQNYGWPDETESPAAETPVSLDDATLIEYYSYSNLNTELRLGDADFDRANPDYRFR